MPVIPAPIMMTVGLVFRAWRRCASAGVRQGDGLEGVAPAVSASREGLAAADKAWFMVSLPVPSSALG